MTGVAGSQAGACVREARLQPSLAYGAIVEDAVVRHVDGAHGLVMALPEGEAGYVNVRVRGGGRRALRPRADGERAWLNSGGWPGTP